MLEFDPEKRRMSVIKTYGERANSRRSHCAAMYEDSMLVYGGQSETGFFFNECLVLHMENLEWVQLKIKQAFQPFSQDACCTVLDNKLEDPKFKALNVSDSSSLIDFLEEPRADRERYLLLRR